MESKELRVKCMKSTWITIFFFWLHGVLWFVGMSFVQIHILSYSEFNLENV